MLSFSINHRKVLICCIHSIFQRRETDNNQRRPERNVPSNSNKQAYVPPHAKSHNGHSSTAEREQSDLRQSPTAKHKEETESDRRRERKDSTDSPRTRPDSIDIPQSQPVQSHKSQKDRGCYSLSQLFPSDPLFH